jgi:TPR repeat protein
MSAGLNRNADLRLADVLSREVEKTPSGELLAETVEDFGDGRALVSEFDAAFARAVARTRRGHIFDRVKALAAQVLTLPSWKPMAATVAALLVLVAGTLYLPNRAEHDATTARLAEGKTKSKAVATESTADAPSSVAETQRRALRDISRGLGRVEPEALELDILAADIAELSRAGNLAAAVASAERYLVLAKSSYGDEHPKYAAGLMSLAEIYFSQARYDEAEPLLKRSLAVREKALGSDDAEVVTALNRLAALYEAQGRYTNAREWYAKAAAAGNAVAMANIGAFYANGLGVPRDYDKAIEWYEKAVAAGDAVAMTEIGVLYHAGLGVPRDFAKAREWFEMAAAAGHAIAMSNLGRLYAGGEGVPRDYAKAREWLEKAAAAGDRSALGALSWHALFAREFAQALDAAERALKADPDLLWIATNRAHALMYLGRPAEAREVYLMHRDKQIIQHENKTWQQVIAEDFDELRKAGLDHPQMAEIGAALGTAK